MEPKNPRTPLQKPSLAEVLSGQLKNHILEKTWAVEMPGIRSLSERFGVSTLVVKRALADLEEKGFISPAEKGKARRILDTGADTASGTERILFLRPHKHLISSFSMEVYGQCLKLLLETSTPFKEIALDVKDGTNFSIPKRLGLHKSCHFKGIVACDVAHDVVRKTTGPDVPLLIMGPEMMEDGKCASVALSITDTVGKFMEHIFHLGIRHVPVFPSYPTKDLHSKLSQYLAEIYQRNGIPYREDWHLPFSNYQSIESCIKHIIETRMPDAVICFGNDQWCFLTHYFQQRGIRAEVHCLFDTPLMRLFKKPPYVCQPNYDQYAETLSDWYADLGKGKAPTFTRRVSSRFIWEKE